MTGKNGGQTDIGYGRLVKYVSSRESKELWKDYRCELLIENIDKRIRIYLLISTCNYPRKERIYAGAFLFQKIRTQCPKSAIRTGCKVGGRSARLYLENFTAAARGIPAAMDSRR